MSYPLHLLRNIFLRNWYDFLIVILCSFAIYHGIRLPFMISFVFKPSPSVEWPLPHQVGWSVVSPKVKTTRFRPDVDDLSFSGGRSHVGPSTRTHSHPQAYPCPWGVPCIRRGLETKGTVLPVPFRQWSDSDITGSPWHRTRPRPRWPTGPWVKVSPLLSSQRRRTSKEVAGHVSSNYL